MPIKRSISNVNQFWFFAIPPNANMTMAVYKWQCCISSRKKRKKIRRNNPQINKNKPKVNKTGIDGNNGIIIADNIDEGDNDDDDNLI